LISSAWDSSLKAYDEEIPESSTLLRHSIGGHLREDICAMSVSVELSLIATGSCSGIIALWDFETNKVEAYFMDH
jgi:WD40 repeat protein